MMHDSALPPSNFPTQSQNKTQTQTHTRTLSLTNTNTTLLLLRELVKQAVVDILTFRTPTSLRVLHFFNNMSGE